MNKKTKEEELKKVNCDNIQWAMTALIMMMSHSFGHSAPQTVINVYTNKPETKLI